MSTNKKKIRKWPFVLAAILLIAGAVGYYFYNNYLAGNRWKPLLQQQLKELVLKSSDSLYHIEYSDFDLNIASGNITLSNFRLLPDTLAYQKLVALKKAPDNLFILSVEKLSIKNIGAQKAYRQRKLDIDEISIQKPNVTVINQRYAFNDTVKIGSPKNPYQLIKKIFRQLHINTISLNDASLNYIDKNSPATKQTSLKHVGVKISDIVVDSISGTDPNRFYYTKGVEITVQDYHIATADSLYFADVKKVFFSTAQKKIVLDRLTFMPRYNRADFYKQTGKAGDIYTLKFKRIDINELDLQRFLHDQKLYAGTMDVVDAEIGIYTNNAFKGKESVTIGKDPEQALQKVALNMRLKRLNIKNALINYSETDAESGATGQVIFKHTNGFILNVTNDKAVKRANPYMRAFIHTRFMDAAPLKVNFIFNLDAKDGAFNYSGELGKFDGRVLDKLVEPLAYVHVKSADIEKLIFDVNASNYSGKGKLEFYYKNLNLQLMEKAAGKPGLQKQGLLSLLANDFIIDDNNPNKKGVFRPGPIDLKRGPNVTFFTFLYKALLDGLKPSVGYNKKTEQNVNIAITKVSKLVDKFDNFKKEVKQRREERKKERRARKDSLRNNKK
jgi:hypothetical protein